MTHDLFHTDTAKDMAKVFRADALREIAKGCDTYAQILTEQGQDMWRNRTENGKPLSEAANHMKDGNQYATLATLLNALADLAA